jgi:hypothetical protein
MLHRPLVTDEIDAEDAALAPAPAAGCPMVGRSAPQRLS